MRNSSGLLVVGKLVLALGAAREGAQVPQGAGGDLVQGLLGEEGLVAADEDVVEGGQTHEQVIVDDVTGVVSVEEAALALVHVEGDAAEPPALERSEQRVRLYQAAAGGVDELGAGLHARQRLLVDDVVGALHQGAVEADEVGLAQHLVQLRVGAVLAELVVLEGVEAEDAAAEAGAHDAREAHADAAGADDADGLAGEGLAQEPVEAEVALAHAVVRPVRVPVQRLQQGDGELGHGLGRVRRHVGDEEPEALRRVQVHVVEARAPQEHRLHALLLQALEDLGVGRVVDEDADGARALGERHRLSGQGQLDELDLDIVVALQVELVVGLCRVDHYFVPHD